MLIEMIGGILFIIMAVALIIDIPPIFGDWLARIHIGRFKDKKIWNNTITDIGVKWLNKTPKIKITDNTRLIVIDMLKNNYTKGSIQHWQEASLVLGLSDYLKANDNKKVENEIKKFVDSKFDKNGQWIDKPIDIDATILAYSIMKLEFIDTNKFKNALDYIWEMIKDRIGVDGTVQYRKGMKDYRYVDTIGFICPFLVAYGVRYNKGECIDLAVKQIKEYEMYGMLDKHHIPCHAYKIKNKIPHGIFGWGRGLGWFSIGLMDSWRELPNNNKYKFVLEDSIKKFSEAARNFQQDNGSWNWVVTRSECRADSSATATLCWFMLNASKVVETSKECLESAEKAMYYLMGVTRRNGVVDFSQGDTKDIGVYSNIFNLLPFTQGFCIRYMNSYIHKS